MTYSLLRQEAAVDNGSSIPVGAGEGGLTAVEMFSVILGKFL